jgi:hypothetical protein
VQTVNNLPDDIDRTTENYTPAVYTRFAGVCVRPGGLGADIAARGLVEKLRKHYDTMIEDLRRERALLDEPLGEGECTPGKTSDSTMPTS